MKSIIELKPDIIIVGAGITGCTIANILGDKGWKVLILEKRNMIGGNCADVPYDNYYIHKYGPHVFHTSDLDIWNYLNEFTKFNNFINTPLVRPEGYSKELFNLPFNMNLFSKFYHESDPNKVLELLKEDVEKSCKKRKIIKDDQKNLEEQAISVVGEKIYKAFIDKYTEKQWGKKCSEMRPEVIKRIPLRYTYNNNYFNDQFQGIPIHGYTNMMSNMVKGPHIFIRLGTNFKDMEFEIMKYVKNRDIPIVYTGPIDELFDYKYGYLEWRSMKFENDIKNVSNYQGNAIINDATSKNGYVRTIEHKHFWCLNQEEIYKYNRSYVSVETAVEWKPGMEPYYPIISEENDKILRKYEAEVDKWENLYLIGRLAEYKYKDMAPSINDAIKLTWELLQDFPK